MPHLRMEEMGRQCGQRGEDHSEGLLARYHPKKERIEAGRSGFPARRLHLKERRKRSRGSGESKGRPLSRREPPFPVIDLTEDEADDKPTVADRDARWTHCKLPASATRSSSTGSRGSTAVRMRRKAKENKRSLASSTSQARYHGTNREYDAPGSLQLLLDLPAMPQDMLLSRPGKDWAP